MHSPTLLVLVIATLVSFVAASDCEGRSVQQSHKAHSKHNKHHTAIRAAKHRKSQKTHKKSAKPKTSNVNSVVSSTGLTSKLASVSSACGAADPTAETTLTGGPNGKESFLNCGITGAGWNPPMVTMDMLKVVDMADAKDVYGACTKYQSLFEKYGKQFNIQPTILAAFAMQESSCNPNESGDSGGAFGLMQITKDKCGGAPNGDCADPDFNVKMGAKTFADGLKEANGNVLIAFGAYNGWYPQMTKADATKAANSDCCECQQNLDYLHQLVNGWLCGKDPYSMQLGSFNNLAVCGSN